MTGFMYPDQWGDWAEVWQPHVPGHPTWGPYVGVLCEDESDRRFEHDYHELGDDVAVMLSAENPPYPGWCPMPDRRSQR